MEFNFDETRILSELSVSRAYVSEFRDNLAHNETIAGYYFDMYEDFGRDRFYNLGCEVGSCGDLWQFDRHQKLRIMDLVRLQLCHNSFCHNCQKMRQASNLVRFTPLLLETSERCDLYHIVLTVPNVPGEKLSTYIDIIFEAFRRLVRILRGKDRLRGFNPSSLGFAAAVRALEVTYNNVPRVDYHPHLHCIVAFRRGLDMSKIHRNKFSYDYTGGRRVWVRDFSDLELFLQRLWRLLVNQIAARVYKFGPKLGEPLPRRDPVNALFADTGKPKRCADAITLDAVRALGINGGYSVVCDPVSNDHFVQVFKYAFKLTSDDKTPIFMTSENFRTLYFALLGRHKIQGYGEWYRMRGDDDFDESRAEFYDLFKAYLWQVDRPESVSYKVDEVLTLMDEGGYTWITPRKIHHILSDSAEADALRSNEDLRSAVPDRSPYSPPDLSSAYYRYLRSKRETKLFEDLRRVSDPDSGKQLVLLSPQQLSYLSQIF